MSDCRGSSSNTSITTREGSFTVAPEAVTASPCTMSVAGEANRKRSRNATVAIAPNRAHWRTATKRTNR